MRTSISRTAIFVLLTAMAGHPALAQTPAPQNPSEVSCKSLFSFSRVSIPSAHMEPTLWTGRCYSVTAPDTDWRRGDIVTYRRNGTLYITRLIGLPGDTVQMQDGRLILNGTPVPTTPIVGGRPDCPEHSDCSGTWLIEFLPDGPSYLTQDMGESRADTTEIFTVPEGHVFILSDNRDNSLDSRFQPPLGPGFIRLDELKSRARLPD